MADRGARWKCLRGALYLALYALGCAPVIVHAEALTTAPKHEDAQQNEGVAAEAVLDQARELLETAQFGAAERALTELLARSELTAQQRNDALELSAILHIAQRNEGKAQQALALLFSRDPGHRRRVTDLGPAVDAAFARAEQSPREPLDVGVEVALAPAQPQQLALSVRLPRGQSAVESVHLHLRLSGDREAHLVSDTHGQAHVSFPLSVLTPDDGVLRLYIDAHAPSGVVLASAGSAEVPLRFTAPAPPLAGCAVVEKPLRKQWWVWTTVGLVLSGITVASALSAN